jgi:hypothetical protein
LNIFFAKNRQNSSNGFTGASQWGANVLLEHPQLGQTLFELHKLIPWN